MANQDIYNRDVSNLAGVFTADRAKLTFKNGLNALTQRMQLSYAQTITRLYEVGSSNIYYVGGRTQGNAAIDRVIGPTSTVSAFYQMYGDVCGSRGRNISLTLTETDCSANAGGGGSTTLTIANVVITQVSIGVQSQEMIISDNTTLMYTSLSTQGN